jgi:HEAT repeat protein
MEVRRSEVMALGELGGQQAIEGLSRISTDPDEYRFVRTAAEEVLGKLRGGEAGNSSSPS